MKLCMSAVLQKVYLLESSYAQERPYLGNITALDLQYLHDDVGCSLQYKPGYNEAELLEWLLHLALSFLHEDTQERTCEAGEQSMLL